MEEAEGFLQRVSHPSNKWRKMLLLLVLTAWNWTPIIHGELYDSEGPQFTQEPSRYNYFTNVQGLMLHCNAKGSPKPQVQWIVQKDGQPVLSYSGIREVFPNGTIYFPPFPVSFYRPDVHDQTYVCFVSNTVGKIRSRDVFVRAVVNQRYEVRIEDTYATEGNDALFRCIIPDAVKDFVSVTSWTKDSTYNIFPHSGAGGRYVMFPSGELLIEEVSRNDSSTFRCRTINKLTGEAQLSENSARLQVSGGSGSSSKSASSPPSINSRFSKLKLKEGEVAVLLCLSSGWPPPTHWWLRANDGYGGFETLRQTERIRIRKSAVIIENVGVQDSRTYVCFANSSVGSDRHQIDLIVASPLSVQVVPPVLTVDIGKSAELACWTNSPDESSSSSSSHSTSTTRQITWRKDGIEIRTSLRLSLTIAGDKLRIANVQREDKGIYQCFVKSDSDMAQASAELRLGDAAPQLVYRFIEQTIRPGPSVSLKCSAVGNPTPQILWYLDGFTLPHSERLLIGQYVTLNGNVVSHVNISSSRVEDGGEFKCVASNKLGISSHSARLNVYGPPFVRNMPSSITAVAGKDFKIKCPVAGYPLERVIWEKDGQALPLTRRQVVTTDGTLTVKDVDRSVDVGWYTCIASNKQGSSDRKGVQLNVVVPPKIVPFSFPEETKEGMRIFVPCVVSEGDVPMRLKWLKNKQIVGDTLSPTDQIELSPSSISHGNSDISTHRIGDFDALVLQITHVKSHDAANYSCEAENSGGKTVHTSELVVHVPPKIAPFSFPAQVSQGSRVQAVCSVEQGDIEETNLTVTWLKDFEPLVGSPTPRLSMSVSGTGTMTTANFVKVVHVDAYSAMLIIERVDSSHSGNWTCRISNSVDSVSSTVPLVVRVPPKWIVEPKETEVAEGSPVLVPCQASGFPSPSISWKKAMGSRPENYRDIPVQSTSITSGGINSGSIGLQHQPGGSLTVISSSSEDTLYSLSNGTLVIRFARKVHQGFYLCESVNGIGTGLSKVIKLVVNVPVHVKEPQQNVSSRVGTKALLRCEISGDGPITDLGWKRGLSEIKPEIDPRYHIRTLNNSQGIFSELTINNVGREDTARYVCSAANQHGRSQGAVFLYVQEPPDIPRNLHVISKGSRFVRLGWILTQDGNSPITQFVIKYKEESGSTNDFHEIVVAGQLFSETVGNLRPGKKYLFSLIAENQVGQSETSEMLEVKTDGEAPEGKPRNVRVTAVSSSDIQVTWEHPEKDAWHGELLGFYLGYKRYREGEQYQFNTVERREGLQEYQIKGLHAFSSYEIVVQAYNGIGAGPFSEPIVATTLEDVPSNSPEGVHCSPLTSHNLQLSWNPLSLEHARGLIKGYKIYLERTDFDILDVDEPPLIRTTPSTNIIVSGLAKYTNYSIQVQAFTIAGDGPMSIPIYCHTEEDLPGSPSAIKSVVSSPSSVTVAWLPPSEPNGQLTKYTVYISTSEAGKASKDAIKRKRQVPPDITKFQFDGLRVDEKYEFRVTASTRVGEGSHVVSHRVQTKTVQSAITTFGDIYRIVWKTDVRLLCEVVGNPSIQWTRYTENVRDTDRISGSREGTLLIRNVKREDGGNYSCSITGNKGHVIDSITHKLVVQVPPLGPLLNAAVNSHSSLNLQWKLSDSGGAPIRGYILHLKAVEEWLERRISRHLTSYELKDLECGTRYQMYLTAYNRAGMGRASEMVNISTLGSAPSLSLVAPQFMVETNRTWARVLLRDVWSANGCKIHVFQIFFKEQDSSHWQTVGGELNGESHSVDLVGLKGGTSYTVKVIATNSAGSNQAEVTINTPSSPGLGAETSNNIMNHPISTPFYLDIKLMVPILLSSVAVLVAITGVCLCFRKKAPIDCRSSDRLSMGTPSSSTYFKQNQRNSQQCYMTVKKSTPLKGVDCTDLEPIPQYADDIYPYATFELNESRRDSKACASVPTLDRRRSSGPGHWNPDMVMLQENNRSNSKSKIPRSSHMKQDESEEYDSYGSDTDTEREIPSGTNRLSIHSAVPNRINSKFQDYDSHARHGNRYEFAPPSNAAMLKYQDKTRQMQNEIHGMVMSEPYFFNDAYPTDDRRPRGGRKTNKRKSQGHTVTSSQQQQQQSNLMYDTTAYEMSFPRKVHLDPPYGFKDPQG